MKTFAVAAVAAYLALVALLYFAQRSLLYFPDPRRVAPQDAGFVDATEHELKSADGERILVWHLAPKDGKPVILYFHGNGGSLAYRRERFIALEQAGFGLVALSYRGYGGSSGSPSEDGLIEDARAAYEFALARYPAARIALWGESLGGAVAIALAAERPVARLVLESPFTSVEELASAIYWFVPVRLLLKDRFRSDLRIAKVKASVLVLHGVNDRVVPIRYGERLYSLIPGEKKFVKFETGDHNDLDRFGATKAAMAFLLTR
jgi:fermentation-respiration switch protein FrsA (DUF1100 family)